MPFEARKRMMWSDCESPLDSQGRHMHKEVKIGDEVVSVPPKCVERKIVAEVDRISGRPWAEIPSHFAPASAVGPTEALPPKPAPKPAEQPAPVVDSQPVDEQPAPAKPVEKPAPKPRRPRKAPKRRT